MKFENIVRNLKKDGYKVELMQFSFQDVLGCRGTALIDLMEEKVVETTAKYSDVLLQIKNNKSHIQTIEGKKKYLTEYEKMHWSSGMD